MTSPALETVPNSMSDSDRHVSDGEPRYMNNEETRRYHSAALTSDDYNVPYFPGPVAFRTMGPMLRYYAKDVGEIAQAATDHYNITSGYNYEIVKIKKATRQPCCYRYFITFYVKPAGLDEPITTFEAIVFIGLPHEAMIFEMIRPEPEEHKHLDSLEGVVVDDLN